MSNPNDFVIHCGDALEVLKTLPSESVNCCITSPPYYGLRDYGMAGQIGLDDTPEQYVERLVTVFREMRRVLRDDGTFWLNIGDGYAGSRGNSGGHNRGSGKQREITTGSDAHEQEYDGLEQWHPPTSDKPEGCKAKDLIGVPWMLAFALRADGWYLRSEIIWCLSGGVWVYARTQKGDMPVMIKDLVRLNPSTVQLWNGDKWSQCLGWSLSSDTGERIELVLRSGERIGCTGSHVWPTQRGNVESRTLRVGDTLRMCHLPQPDDTKRPDYLTDDLLWLIGLYMAEGSRSGDTIQIALNSDEVAWLPRIKRAATDGGASMSHTLSGNTLCVRLYGKVLNAVLRDYIGGDTAKTKRFTSKVWLLPNDALKFIAEGYLGGDGHVDGNRIRLGFCRNYLLERALRTLAARLGATLTLKTATATYQNGTKPSFCGEWRWERSGHHNEKDRGEIVIIRASRARQFWDLSVVDDPHVFALASGVLKPNLRVPSSSAFR